MVGGCLSALASETFQVSWDSLEFYHADRPHPSQRVTIVSLPPEGLTVLDKASKPTFLFERQSTLFVQSTEDENFGSVLVFVLLKEQTFLNFPKPTPEEGVNVFPTSPLEVPKSRIFRTTSGHLPESTYAPTGHEIFRMFFDMPPVKLRSAYDT
jgi:hypothetical protein